MTLLGINASDWAAIVVTVKLAVTVTMILLVVSAPLCWWLARSRSWLRAPVAALVAMPLILPPTVLGFYFLLLFSPNSSLGGVLSDLGFGQLLFSYWGLVVASCIYSLPFVVQPIYLSMQNISPKILEAAQIMGAGPLDCFKSVVLPMAKPGFITAAILGFAHTVGEFGVVLMVGGNIPGSTRVLSIQIYEHVEALDYAAAHSLSAGLIVFSFVVLLMVYLNQSKLRTSPAGDTQ